MLANVKIEQDKENRHIHRVFIDGKQIEKITHIDFEINPLEIPRINIETMSGIDFEGQAEVDFEYGEDSVRMAFEILRKELVNHGAVYLGFSASIKSAISDFFNENESKSWVADELSETIIKRIVGVE